MVEFNSNYENLVRQKVSYVRPMFTAYETGNKINFVSEIFVQTGFFYQNANEIIFQFRFAPNFNKIAIQSRWNLGDYEIEINGVFRFMSRPFL